MKTEVFRLKKNSVWVHVDLRGMSKVKVRLQTTVSGSEAEDGGLLRAAEVVHGVLVGW